MPGCKKRPGERPPPQTRQRLLSAQSAARRGVEISSFGYQNSSKKRAGLQKTPWKPRQRTGWSCWRSPEAALLLKNLSVGPLERRFNYSVEIKCANPLGTRGMSPTARQSASFRRVKSAGCHWGRWHRLPGCSCRTSGPRTRGTYEGEPFICDKAINY